MRNPLRIVALFWLLALLPASAVAQLQAGAARVSITPDPKMLPYPLGGYVSPERLGHNATGIHDTCYARALVLKRESVKCAIVSLDLCFMPANVKQEVLSRIRGIGIAATALFLACTHTHTALDPLILHSANIGPAGALPQFDSKALEFVSDRIAQAIKEADSKLMPAKAGSGQAQKLGLNRNRRGEVITDDEMTCLKLTDSADQPLAVIFNYAAHPVYYGPDMMQVSGDWAGAFERQVEASIPGSVALFLNGAEGDASPNGADEGMPAEKIQTYSAKILGKALQLYNGIQCVSDARLSAWSQPFDLPERKPHPLFLLAASQLKATPDQARQFVDRMMPKSAEISLVLVGQALFMGVPGEPTAPTGLEAKSIARAKGIVNPAIVALTNGWLGYLPSTEQYKAGKYEAIMSFYGDQIGPTIVAGIRKALEKP